MSPAIGIGVSACFGANVVPWRVLQLAPTEYMRSDYVTLTGSDVTTWQDLSGNGNDYSGAAAPPAYDSGGTLPKLVFVGASAERLTHADLAKPAAYHVSMVLDMGTTFASKYLWTLGASGSTLMFTAGGAPELSHTAVASKAHGDAMPAGTVHLEWGWTGASIRLRMNGGAWASKVCGSLGGTYAGDSAIGAHPDGFVPCDIDGLYEHIYLTRTPSDGELANLRAYVTARYGV